VASKAEGKHVSHDKGDFPPSFPKRIDFSHPLWQELRLFPFSPSFTKQQLSPSFSSPSSRGPPSSFPFFRAQRFFCLDVRRAFSARSPPPFPSSPGLPRRRAPLPSIEVLWRGDEDETLLFSFLPFPSLQESDLPGFPFSFLSRCCCEPLEVLGLSADSG